MGWLTQLTACRAESLTNLPNHTLCLDHDNFRDERGEWWILEVEYAGPVYNAFSAVAEESGLLLESGIFGSGGGMRGAAFSFLRGGVFVMMMSRFSGGGECLIFPF